MKTESRETLGRAGVQQRHHRAHIGYGRPHGSPPITVGELMAWFAQFEDEAPVSLHNGGRQQFYLRVDESVDRGDEAS